MTVFLILIGMVLVLPIYGALLLATPVGDMALVQSFFDFYRLVAAVPLQVIVLFPDSLADSWGMWGASRAVFLYAAFVVISYGLALVIGKGAEVAYRVVRRAI